MLALILFVAIDFAPWGYRRWFSSLRLYPTKRMSIFHLYFSLFLCQLDDNYINMIYPESIRDEFRNKIGFINPPCVIVISIAIDITSWGNQRKRGLTRQTAWPKCYVLHVITVLKLCQFFLTISLVFVIYLLQRPLQTHTNLSSSHLTSHINFVCQLHRPKFFLSNIWTPCFLRERQKDLLSQLRKKKMYGVSLFYLHSWNQEAVWMNVFSCICLVKAAKKLFFIIK